MTGQAVFIGIATLYAREIFHKSLEKDTCRIKINLTI